MAPSATYQPPGPFSQQPGPGLARITMPPTEERRQLGGVEHAFSSYMPHVQALTWARELSTAYQRPFRVVQ